MCYLPEILTFKSDSNADVMLEKRWKIVVYKAKDKYEAALDELNRLMQKREEARRKELMECNNGTPCQDTKLNFYHEPFFANYV